MCRVLENKDKILETDRAQIAAKAGVSPKGNAGTPTPEGAKGLVFEFDTPDPFASPKVDNTPKNEPSVKSAVADEKSPAQSEKASADSSAASSDTSAKSTPFGASVNTAKTTPATAKSNTASANSGSSATDGSPYTAQNVTPVSIFDVYSDGEGGEADSRANIRRTYVPRFTDVSETYRMKDDPRPRKKLPETEERTVAEKIDVSELPAEEPKSPSDELDPTAELDERTDGVIVSMDKPTHDEGAETLSVYKFKDESAEKAPEPTPEQEEIELKKLLKSLGRFMEADREELAEKECAEQEPAQSEEKVYSVPDPDKDEISVRDYDTAKREEYTQIDPEGVSNELPEMPDRKSVV